jgi:putative ABC transport system ATP-binding protein
LSDILVISNLKKVYGNKVKTIALDNINLNIKEGEFIAVIGESGCGKTTLLNLIAGLDYPTSGKIKIEGVEITTLNDQELATLRSNKIGIVFQFFNLIPILTSSENIELAMMVANKTENDQQRRAKELLKMIGLADKANSKPNELSGGEQQRVAIARAFANDTKLILMDEPTGNLDSKTSKDFMKYICNLHKEGKTIIMATHDQTLTKDADRIITMKDGRII